MCGIAYSCLNLVITIKTKSTKVLFSVVLYYDMMVIKKNWFIPSCIYGTCKWDKVL